MADIILQIDGRSYSVACDDGQEDRLAQLGSYVDQRIKNVSAAAAGNKAQAMMLASLLLADEVFDLHEKMEILQRTHAQIKTEQPQVIAYEGLAPTDEQEITSLISRMTSRVEQICLRAARSA